MHFLLHPIWGNIHPDIFPAYTSPTYKWSSTSCAVRVTKLVYRNENTWLVLLHEQQSPQEDICPWASGAYGVEAFLFYRSLKHSNLKLIILFIRRTT